MGTRLLVLAGLLVGAAACSTSHDKTKAMPTVYEIDVPATATATAGGWTITGSVKFYDDDDTVAAIHVRTAEPPYADDTFQITPVQLGVAPITVPFPATVPDGGVGFAKGTYTLLVLGVDSTGLEGAPATQSVELP